MGGSRLVSNEGGGQNGGRGKGKGAAINVWQTSDLLCLSGMGCRGGDNGRGIGGLCHPLPPFL